MTDDHIFELKGTTKRLLRALVALISNPRPEEEQTSRMRSCLGGLLGNLTETLSRRDDAELVQCHVLVNDPQRHWRIKLYLVPEPLGGRTFTRIRTVAERFPK